MMNMSYGRIVFIFCLFSCFYLSANLNSNAASLETELFNRQLDLVLNTDDKMVQLTGQEALLLVELSPEKNKTMSHEQVMGNKYGSKSAIVNGKPSLHNTQGILLSLDIRSP